MQPAAPPRHRLRNLSSPEPPQSCQHAQAEGEVTSCHPGTVILYHSRCLLNQRRISRCPLLRSPRASHGSLQPERWDCAEQAAMDAFLGCLTPEKSYRKPLVLSLKCQPKQTHPGTLRKGRETTLSAPSTNPKCSQTPASRNLLPSVI